MWTNRLRPYDLLSGDEVEAIDEQAMTILDPGGDEALKEFTARRKREIGDD